MNKETYRHTHQLPLPIQWVPEALSLGVKWQVWEADHSPPSSAEVENACSYTSTLPIRLHGVVLSTGCLYVVVFS